MREIIDDSLRQKLKDSGIKFIRLLWCDNANVIRTKSAHINFLDDCARNGIGISVAQQAIPVMCDVVVPEAGLMPVGEVRLMPDWSTLTILPYAEGHAQVLSDMIVGATRNVWEHCPRGFLRRQKKRLAERGLTLQSAFENEFYLLYRNSEGTLKSVDETVFCQTDSMNHNRAFINNLADAFNVQGIEVEGYYPEAGPGQQEMNIRYAESLQAADRQIIYRETVRGVAAKHGLIASFLPMIFEDKAGSGCHINFSLWREGENISGDSKQPNGISREAAAFVAGILDHLPALAAVTIPSINSYRRIRPHCWVGAFRAWGYQNREAAVRICKNLVETKADRFEFKTADASSNPYLAQGALIAAGLDGLQRNLELTEEVTVDPGYIPEDERKAKGIDLLPQSLGESLEALLKDQALLEAFGEDLARSFMAVRQAEWEALKDMNLEEEVNLLMKKY
ncbi:glutamine synthetase family protein [Acidobacteriota bacterium]